MLTVLYALAFSCLFASALAWALSGKHMDWVWPYEWSPLQDIVRSTFFIPRYLPLQPVTKTS